MSKRVAIILVNWNSFSITGDCIQSLGFTHYSNYDIILVDNASKDFSGNALKEAYPHIILLQANSNLGFSGGNNTGIQYAMEQGYEYVLLLNNDTFVATDFLGILVDYMDSHKEIGAVQPLIYFNHNRSLVWNAGSYFKKWLGKTIVNDYNRTLSPENNHIKEVDWITGCAFFSRISVLNETGFFAENLFMYYEDVDLSFRIRQAGYRLIFLPHSVIYHIAGGSGKTENVGNKGLLNPLIHYYTIRNRIWLLKKYTPDPYKGIAFLYHSIYISSVIIYMILRGRFTKCKMILKGVKDGISGNIYYQ